MSFLRSPAALATSASARETSAPSIEGVGLHSGLRLKVTLKEGAPGQGVRFELHLDGEIYSAPAHWLRVSGTSRATAIVLRGTGRRRYELSTIEHLLAAVFASGRVDLNVVMEALDPVGESIELPALDGAADAWAELCAQLAPVRGPWTGPCWKVLRSVEVADGNRRAILSPLEDANAALSKFHCQVDFGGAWKQAAYFEIDWTRPDVSFQKFRAELAPARTFGFQAELKALEARGLARGANLSNAILLDGDRVVNEGGLRFENELAAHKLVDAIGDLALMGSPFLGRLDLNAAGHSMHVRLVEEAFRTGALAKGRLTPSGFVRDDSNPLS